MGREQAKFLRYVLEGQIPSPLAFEYIKQPGQYFLQGKDLQFFIESDPRSRCVVPRISNTKVAN